VRLMAESREEEKPPESEGFYDRVPAERVMLTHSYQGRLVCRPFEYRS